MRRPHPIFSPFAMVATGILLILLTIALLWRGGQAFSPGQLSDVHKGKLTQGDYQSHAEFQGECTLCHSPFVGIEAERCGVCHELVMNQLNENDGFHGQVGSNNCVECHSEHQGSDFDLLENALAEFSVADHATFFLLDGGHEALDCSSCHVTDSFAEAGNLCIDCHEEPDVHANEFGTQCSRCHTTSSWQGAAMAAHPFPLNHGVGQDIPCASCHTESLTTYSCQSCHEHRPELTTAQHRTVDLGDISITACASCHITGQVEASR